MLRSIQNKNVYHGSYCIVKEPATGAGADGKDFGKGFYVTTDRQQAISFAGIKAKREKQPSGFVTIYRLSSLQGLNVFEFEKADESWLNCVVGFRNKNYSYLAAAYSDYDVLIGKIADDDTSMVLNAYMSGAYGDAGTPNAVKIAISMLKTDRLKNQICFKNDHAISRLSYFKHEVHWI